MLPLDLRRHFLGLTYVGRSARLERTITLDLYAEHLNFQFWEHRATRRGIAIPWIGLAKKILSELDLNLGEINKFHQNYFDNPYEIQINFTMLTTTKQNLTPNEANIKFLQMLSLYERYTPVYTDHTSIFTAEMYAISMAIDKINDSPETNFLICSDSLSALQTLKSGIENSLSHKIMHKIATTNKTIKLEWVPSHMDIPGNEAAEKKAGEALNLNNIA